MRGWRTWIRCYVSPGRNNKIADWYDRLSPREKVDADQFLSIMRKTRDWQSPDYRPIKGGYGIGELRWFAEQKQQRLLGFFMDGVWYALVGCTHKQRVYDPRDCLETAKKRKKQIENGEVSTVEYDL